MRALLPLSLLVATPLVHAAPAASLQARVDARDAQAYHFEVALDRPSSLTLRCEEAGNPLERLRIDSPSSRTHHLTLRGFKADTRYQCRLDPKATSGRLPAPVSFRTAPLPPGLVAPKISVPSTDIARTAYTLYNYIHAVRRVTYTYLVILDAQGNIRWYYKPYESNSGGGGDLDATWLGNDRIAWGGDLKHNVPPTVIGLDKQTYFTGAVQNVSATDLPTRFTHDSGPSEDGSTYLYLNDTDVTGYGSTDPDGSTVVGFVAKEIDPLSNQVIWYWDSMEDGYLKGNLDDPGAWYSSQNQFPNDPYHGNSVEDRWEDGHRYVYIGMRHQNEIIKIDYDTKAVVWRLGLDRDFTLLESNGTAAAGDFRWFFNIHDAHVQGDRAWMFDNGYDRNQYGGNSYSRVLELELDTTRMTARIAFEYTEQGWLEAVFGGYDLLDGGYRLIARPHSGFSSSSTSNSALIELDPAGKVAWRGDFTDTSETMYRADHIDGCDIFDLAEYCPSLR